VGTTISTSIAAVQLAESVEGVWATVGYHPEHFTSDFHDSSEPDAGNYNLDELARIAKSSKKVVAIGETGLDFYRIDEGRDVVTAREIQERGFREQITLAYKLGLPVVIHCREALTRLAEILQEEYRAGKKVKVVIHCYTGTWKEAGPLLDLGAFLSFTGIITFPVKKDADLEHHLHRVIERMPIERMFLETDAPFLTPVPYRGKRNEPLYVKYVAEQIAKLRNCSIDEIAEQTTKNARDFFGI
jgi:TatD DNase family protein